MVHDWNSTMTVTAIFALAVTITGVSCFTPMFAVFAVAGVLLGGGAAWVTNSIRHL